MVHPSGKAMESISVPNIAHAVLLQHNGITNHHIAQFITRFVLAHNDSKRDLINVPTKSSSSPNDRIPSMWSLVASGVSVLSPTCRAIPPHLPSTVLTTHIFRLEIQSHRRFLVVWIHVHPGAGFLRTIIAWWLPICVSEKPVSCKFTKWKQWSNSLGAA